MRTAIGRYVGQIFTHVEMIVGIELMLAALGIDFCCREMGLNPEDLGEGTAVAYPMIREQVPYLDTDVVLYPYIEKMRQLVSDGTLKRAVEERLGMN